jgi:replicative DNA helicase
MESDVMSLMLDENIIRQLDSIAHVGSERAILSIAMADPETLFDITVELEPEDFTNQANKYIYQIMLTILDNKHANIGKVNPMIIFALAQNSGMEEMIGGLNYLQIVAKTDAGVENLKFFVEKVKQASVRREAFRKAVTVMEEAVANEEEEASTFISRQEEKFLDSVMRVENNANEIVRLGDKIDVVLEKRETQPREVLGIPTGFIEYDRATGGLVPSRLKVVAAPPKTGKSAHSLNVGMNVAMQGIPVLYIDTEMTDEEQIDREVSILATDYSGVIVPERLITTGMYARNQKMKQAVDEYAKPLAKEIPLYHVYMPDFTPEKVHNMARKFQRQHGIEWNGFKNQFVLIFDYIKMDESSFKGNQQEYLVLGQITNMLKNKIAGSMGIPVLAYAQINPRTGYGQEDLNSSHISGSNRIVMFVNELSILRRKTPNELAEQGRESGNLVWKLGETRNGGSYEGHIDYTIEKGVAKMNELKNISLE